MTKKHVLIVEKEVHADMRVWFVLVGSSARDEHAAYLRFNIRNVRTLRSDEAVKFVKNYQSTSRKYLK